MIKVNEEIIKQVIQTDWNYDKLSGDLSQYLKAARSYKTTVNTLATLEPEVVDHLVARYAPEYVQTKVYTDVQTAKRKGFYV